MTAPKDRKSIVVENKTFTLIDPDSVVREMANFSPTALPTFSSQDTSEISAFRESP
jgi:hypothetical protein